MNAFAVDLHIHSCLSPCAEDDMTPCNIAGMGYLNGLRIMALTDHNTAKNCPAFFAACREYGIVPVPGIELTTAEDVHMVCLFPKLDTALAFDKLVEEKRMKVKNKPAIFGEQIIMGEQDVPIGNDPWFLPAATSLTIEEGAKLVRSMGGVCYPAHIDREANGLLAVLGFFPEEPVFTLAEVHDEDKRDLAGGRKILVSSDAHRLWEISDGSFCVHLDVSPEAGEEAVRKAFFAMLEKKS